MIHEFISKQWAKNYQLLDSGKGRKLEQFGPYTLIRPDQRVIWKPALPLERWLGAAAEFVLNEKGGGGQWQRRTHLPDEWQLEYNDLRIKVMLESSRQVGFFS